MPPMQGDHEGHLETWASVRARKIDTGRFPQSQALFRKLFAGGRGAAR